MWLNKILFKHCSDWGENNDLDRHFSIKIFYDLWKSDYKSEPNNVFVLLITINCEKKSFQDIVHSSNSCYNTLYPPHREQRPTVVCQTQVRLR